MDSIEITFFLRDNPVSPSTSADALQLSFLGKVREN